MKVCKKCKKKVANKAKVCRYCGADVSKAKIIPNTSNKKGNTKAATTVNKKAASANSQSKVSNKKNSSVQSKTTNKKNVNTQTKDVKPKVKADTAKKVVSNQKVKKEVEKKPVEEIKVIEEVKPIEVKQESKKANKINKKETALKVGKGVTGVFKYILLELVSSLKITFFVIYEAVVSVAKSLFKSITSIKDKINNLYLKAKDRKIEKKISMINEEPSPQVLEVVEVPEEKPEERKSKKSRIIKIVFAAVFVLVLCIAAYSVEKYIYKDINGTTKKVVVGEQATTDKIFSMNDVITYKDVDYKIVKVESSKGNNYKSPKEGYQFLIVTVYIKNNSDKKIPYSYENWTMSNSKNEEKKRIFTSINVDTALYSGELVVGGIKTGSMVFEQPINDKKLQLNYYELKKDKDGNDIIDQAKRIFSVSIKTPSKIKNVISKPKQETTKVIKNS